MKKAVTLILIGIFLERNHLLANFLILCYFLNIKEVVEPWLIVGLGQWFVQDRLCEQLVSRQRDLVSGEKALLQFSSFIRLKLHNSLRCGIPTLGCGQELLPCVHQVFKVCMDTQIKEGVICFYKPQLACFYFKKTIKQNSLVKPIPSEIPKHRQSLLCPQHL